MQLELKPSPKLTYKLRLTPQMKLAINLLQMPLVKLKDYVKQQIEENPLLEIENPEQVSEEEKDLQDNYGGYEEQKQNYQEGLITKSTTLVEHLFNQLHLFTHSDDERKIGDVLINNMDDNGYLKSSLEEIAQLTQTELSKVIKVLNLIQTFDPVGVGARDLRECLLLQIKGKGQENSVAGQIIDKYLSFLEKKRFELIARKLKVPVEKVKEAIKEIARLEPKPGRLINTEKTVRLIPDMILEKNGDGLELSLNEWEIPSLNLNPKYKGMLKQKDITEDTKEYLKGRLKAARALINAINKRKETLQKVTEAIVYIQRDFLNNGMYTPTPIWLKKNTTGTIGIGVNLKPMTLSQIANMVGKHKSTVSRAVVNKYLQTPDGIFELRQFLNSGVKQENGVLFSSKAIKSRIKELIKNEDKEEPLTDQKIINLLKQEGISISRRTIAKYRSQLKILPFQSRRE